MDVKEYIASGVVELYAMNALSPDDIKEFEKQRLLHPELNVELTKVEETLETFAVTHARNPRPQLRENIMERIRENGKVIPIKKNKPANDESYIITYKYLIAASLAALVISTFASWFFYTRWNEAEERYTLLLNDKNELAQNYNIMKANYDETTESMIILRDENSKVIVLNSTDTAKHFQARVYWNRETHRSYIDVLALPVPVKGKQFQLWALVGGKPVDAGVFIVGEDGVQRVKDIAIADAWAVTLEPQGGSVSPTMDQMYLLSKNS
jgi:anti-sigma-K factor RskA